MKSTHQFHVEADIASCLTQLQSGDSEEIDLRRRHPSARYRAPHPVFDLSRTLLSWALECGATGMRVMPTARSVEIDFQQEGDFKSAVSLPKDLQEPLAARFKDMASADVTIQELPQNGRVPILWQGKSLAASAAFIPGEYGERITLQFDFT